MNREFKNALELIQIEGRPLLHVNPRTSLHSKGAGSCQRTDSAKSKQDNLIHAIHMFLHDPIAREHTYARQSIQAFLAGFNKLAKLLREAG